MAESPTHPSPWELTPHPEGAGWVFCGEAVASAYKISTTFSFVFLTSPFKMPIFKEISLPLNSRSKFFFQQPDNQIKNCVESIFNKRGSSDSRSGCLAAAGISCLLCWMKSLVMTLLCHQDTELAKPHLRHLCGFSRIPFSNLNPRCYCQLPGKLNREYSGNIK